MGIRRRISISFATYCFADRTLLHWPNDAKVFILLPRSSQIVIECAILSQTRGPQMISIPEASLYVLDQRLSEDLPIGRRVRSQQGWDEVNVIRVVKHNI